MDQEPDFGNLMPDTFTDLGNNSYGAAIDDYQAQMNDYDLRGPNAQFIASNASYDEEGDEGGNEEEDCCSELEAALGEIGCLKDLLLPPDLTGGGPGAWQHTVMSFRPEFTNTAACTASLKSSVSCYAVGVNQASGNVTIRFTRENNDPACQATGSITWIISPNRSGTPNFAPSWSGSRGDTTVVDKEYAPGTYYIYAQGGNLDNNVNGEQYQYKGLFVISTSAEGDPPVLTPKIVRTFEVTNTITDDEPLPCA